MADHPFPFRVNPFPELEVLGEDEQPYTWEGKYGFAGVVQHIALNFGVSPGGLKDNKILAFRMTAFVKPKSIVWEFLSLSDLGPSFQSGDYPHRHLEPLLKKHMDPLLATILAQELEAWHVALIAAARKSITPTDRHPSAAEDARLATWLASHNGVVSLGLPQHRMDESGTRLMRALGF